MIFQNSTAVPVKLANPTATTIIDQRYTASCTNSILYKYYLLPILRTKLFYPDTVLRSRTHLHGPWAMAPGENISRYYFKIVLEDREYSEY